MNAFIFFITFSSVVTTAFTSDVEAEELIPNISSTDTKNDTLNSFKTEKHESLLSCPHFALEPGEYELFPNGTVYIEPYNLLLNESHYIFTNSIVSFCIPFPVENEDKPYVIFTSYITVIGLGISMVCLFVHLIVFVIVPDLKNLPGCNLAALCASLLISYLLIFVITAGDIALYHDFCIAMAFLIHFFLLASILWMSIMSFDVFLSLLRVTGSLRSSSTQFSFKRFGLYCLCSFGVSLVFAVSSLLAEIMDVVPEQYKPQYAEICWFTKKTPLLIFFAGPLIALTCLNFIFFGLSAFCLHRNKMEKAGDEQKSLLKHRYLMYFRLSVIMGTTWVVGIISTVVNDDWIWYVFVLLNTFQGFFIFIAFTCCKKVKKYFREKLLGGRRASQQTLSPTFQSYCFYANSIEKDMDKIVENGKEKTDTIMIHL